MEDPDIDHTQLVEQHNTSNIVMRLTIAGQAQIEASTAMDSGNEAGSESGDSLRARAASIMWCHDQYEQLRDSRNGDRFIPLTIEMKDCTVCSDWMCREAFERHDCPGSARLIQCRQCPWYFRDPSHLLAHKEIVHDNVSAG